MRILLLVFFLLCGMALPDLWLVPHVTSPEPVYAAVPRPLEIVPGQRIGVVSLGQSMGEAKKVLVQIGAVEDNDAEPGARRICNSEPYVGLCVQDYRDVPGEGRASTPGKVLFIVTDDRRYGSEDLKVGASLISLLHRFGHPQRGHANAVEWAEGFGVALLPGREGPQAYLIAVFPAR